MTATRKGQLAWAVPGMAAIAPAAPIPLKKPRRDKDIRISQSQTARERGPAPACHCMTHVASPAEAALFARILFGFSGSRVCHGEAAIRRCDDLEVRAIRCRTFGIRDVGLWTVVCGIGTFGAVNHIESFKSRGLMDSLPCLGATCLMRAVVHDGHARMNRTHNGARVRQIEA